jgi:hypothetical protein
VDSFAGKQIFRMDNHQEDRINEDNATNQASAVSVRLLSFVALNVACDAQEGDDLKGCEEHKGGYFEACDACCWAKLTTGIQCSKQDGTRWSKT